MVGDEDGELHAEDVLEELLTALSEQLRGAADVLSRCVELVGVLRARTCQSSESIHSSTAEAMVRRRLTQ